MSASYNHITLLGNLTRDPELRYAPSGTPIASFSLAVNHKYKKDEEQKEEVMYIDIVLFGRLAENTAQYLNKGKPVLVAGRLTQDRWEDADGVKKSKHKVIGSIVQFLTSPSSSSVGSDESDYA